MNKDANDALVNNPKELEVAVHNTLAEANAEAAQAAEKAKGERAAKAKNYRATQSNAARKDEFIEIGKRNANTPALPTGITPLDNVLGGGLYPAELYVIGAMPGIGKTALVLQIADYIAKMRIEGKHGRDVLYFCLEMTAHELMARSVSRETYLRATGILDNPKNKKGKDKIGDYAITTRAAINGGFLYDLTKKGFDQKEHHGEAYAAGVEAYFKYASGIFAVEGKGAFTVDDILAKVHDYLDATGAKKEDGATPVVIVDYLQLLKPCEDSEGDNDKQRVTNAITKLKNLGDEIQAPIVVISSFSRSGYRGQTKMDAFKESGEVEYCATCLIGLKTATEINDDSTEIKPEKDTGKVGITATILKSRNGLRGDNVDLVFLGAYNIFEPNI